MNNALIREISGDNITGFVEFGTAPLSGGETKKFDVINSSIWLTPAVTNAAHNSKDRGRRECKDLG